MDWKWGTYLMKRIKRSLPLTLSLLLLSTSTLVLSLADEHRLKPNGWEKMRRSTLSVSSAGNFMISPLFAGVATETPPPPPPYFTVSAAYSTYCSSCPPDPCVEFMCVSSSSADVETATGCLLSINKAAFRMMPSHNKPTRT